MSDLNPAFQAPPAPTAPSPADVAPKAPEAKPAEPAAAAPEAAPNISGWLEGKTPELTVENASKVIAAIREDFKAEREKLRGGAAAQEAADKAKADLAQQIGRALGIVKDDEPADPAKLTEQVTSSQAEAKQARVELAVFRNAEAAGADPLALLDSASFLAKVSTLDPSDVAGLTAAMQEAVTANPRLGAVPTSRVPAVNPAQGSSGGGTPPVLTVEQQILAFEKEGKVADANRLRAQMLVDAQRRMQGAQS